MTDDDDEAHLVLSCGCSFTADETDGGVMRIRPCCRPHADHWLLLAVEHGLGAGGIDYPDRGAGD